MDRTMLGEPLEHRTLRVNGIDLHTVLAGPEDGVPVLLLHGFPEFWYAWRHQIGPLAQAGYRVIAPDLRGYNFSSKPSGIRHYVPDRLLADVTGLLDALEAPEAHVAGHDWGGLLAWWLAAAQPARLRRLIILNAPHPVAFKQTLLRHPLQQLRSGYMLFFQLRWLPEFMLAQNDYWLMVQTLVQTSQPGTFTRAELDHYREAWAQPGALSGMLSWYRALPLHAAQPDPGRISNETLIIWGERDFALGTRLANDSLARCDNARLERLPKAGHWLLHEEPNEVNRLMLEFLAAAPEAGRTGA